MTEEIPTSEAIEAVLRNLPVREDRPVPIHSQAHLLSVCLAIYKPEPPTGPLEPATRRQTISQLRQLEKALKQLDRALGELSAPATKSLDQKRQDLSLQWTPSLPQAIRLYIAQSFPSLGEAALAAAEDLEAKEPERGRRKGMSIQTLMQMLADIFCAVTGTAPTRVTDPYRNGREVGVFTQFVAAVFKLAGINQSAEREARWAIDDFKARQKIG